MPNLLGIVQYDHRDISFHRQVGCQTPCLCGTITKNQIKLLIVSIKLLGHYLRVRLKNGIKSVLEIQYRNTITPTWVLCLEAFLT